MINVFGVLVSLDQPHIFPATYNPIIYPSFIILSCGQDAIVENLTGFFISLSCSNFIGSDPFIMEVYKDDILIRNNSFNLFISPASDDDFGTYTFVLSNDCGVSSVVSRILRQGEVIDLALCQFNKFLLLQMIIIEVLLYFCDKILAKVHTSLSYHDPRLYFIVGIDQKFMKAL